MQRFFFKISFGFTLAEVLITLGIIGVVAAMTIPSLVNNINDMHYKTAYKKAYSEISQAFARALSSDEITELTGTWSSIGNQANFETLEKYFSVTKTCTSANIAECWDTSGETFRSENKNTEAFIDKSGMVWKLRDFDSDPLAPGFLVDINGTNGPNKYGQDRFAFFYATTSMSPQNWCADNMGMPSKIIPFRDILVDTDDDSPPQSCRSVKKHPCYYTSWLTNKK